MKLLCVALALLSLGAGRAASLSNDVTVNALRAPAARRISQRVPLMHHVRESDFAEEITAYLDGLYDSIEVAANRSERVLVISGLNSSYRGFLKSYTVNVTKTRFCGGSYEAEETHNIRYGWNRLGPLVVTHLMNHGYTIDFAMTRENDQIAATFYFMIKW